MNYDPFTIGSDHKNHANRVEIITLEGSGRVFCPKCLENQATNQLDLKNLQNETYQQYIKNLFETLDTRSENVKIRNIILPILEACLVIRPYMTKDEFEYHLLLSIINKIIKSDQFEPNEFTLVARIFARISYGQVKSIPLRSVWKVLQQMIEYARNQIKTHPIGNIEIKLVDSCRFFGSLFQIITKYLKLVKSYTIGQVSDIIFPLSEKDEPMLHNRKYYINSQEFCLDFIADILIERCWSHIGKIQLVSLLEERAMVKDFFDALQESFLASIRVNHKIKNLLTHKDCLLLAHDIIYNIHYKEFRLPIRKFLLVFVDHYLREHFGCDEDYEQYIESGETIVETNFKNALVYANDDARSKKCLFYFLVNCIALKIGSKYFKLDKVKSVLQTLNLKKLNIEKSRTLMRAITYTIANLSLTVAEISINIKQFFESLWQAWLEVDSRSERIEFKERFCFDDIVFYWSSGNTKFKQLVSKECIEYILNRGMKDNTVGKNMKNFFDDQSYNIRLCRYLRYELSAVDIIEEVIKLGEQQTDEHDDYYNSLIQNLGDILPSLLHAEILESLADMDNDTRLRAHKLLHMNILLLKGCEKFDMQFDDQFIIDLMRFMEDIYANRIVEARSTLLLLNELVTTLIETNNCYLMTLLKHLDFAIMGYAFHQVKIYDTIDELVESIAHLLVTYNNIDYPLKYKITDNLFPNSVQITRWMLSNNSDLHRLSLERIITTIEKETSKTQRACITTGFIHMLVRSPTYCWEQSYIRLYMPLCEKDEFLYNPLKARIKNFPTLDYSSGRPNAVPSPALTFTSADSYGFDEDQLEVNEIISQLDGGVLFQDDFQIPNNLFVSNTVKDNMSKTPDTGLWEQTAQEAIETTENQIR